MTATLPNPHRRPTVVRIGTRIFARVVVQPVQTGILRRNGWPTGLVSVAGIGLLAYLAATQLVVWAPYARRHLVLLYAGSLSVPRALLPVLLCGSVLAVALLVTGALHAPVPVRLAGLAAAGLVMSVGASHSLAGVWSAAFVVPTLCWLSLLILLLVRWRRPFAWWEFPVVLACLLAGLVVPLGIQAQNGRAGTVLGQLSAINLLLILVASLAIPVTIMAGLALTDVALRTAAWSVEVVSTELGTRTLKVVFALLGAGAVLSVIAEAASPDVLPKTSMLQYAGAAGVVAVVTGAWIGIDRIADRAGPGSTRLTALPDDLRPIGTAIAVAISVSVVAAVSSVELQVLLSLPIESSYPGAGAADFGVWVASLFDRDDLIDGATYLATAAACAVAGVISARRGRRGTAELLATLCIPLALRGLTFLGLTPRLYTLSTVTGVTVALSAAAGLAWLVTGQLSRRRAEALALCLLLSLAVSHRQAISDPLGSLLGLAGGAAVLLGLLWNLLTGSEDANSDSKAFPRPARVLLVIGNVVLGSTVLAVNSLMRGPGGPIDLEAYVETGGDVIGTALLLCALVAVMSSAVRNEEIVEPIGGADSSAAAAATAP